MHAKTQGFWLAKAGNSTSDYEDAFWPRGDETSESFPVRMAIADGATESSFSKLWADLLVEDYGEGRLTPETLGERLHELRGRWLSAVTQKPLPWYAEEKLRSGAFSSLVGLTIELDPEPSLAGGSWTALAIGDSCLFQIREGQLLACHPLDSTEQFNNRPVLIPSVSDLDESLQDFIRLRTGLWKAGDVFYLMTDALACWFLKRWFLRDGDPQGFLRGMDASGEFEPFILGQRSDRAEDNSAMLKNDDVTLVICKIEGTR